MKAHNRGLTKVVLIGLVILSTGQDMMAEELDANRILDIGSRLELFVDQYLIDTLDGVELRLQEPQKQPLPESPLPVAYTTVIKHGGLYRAYYRDRDPDYKGARATGFPGELYRYAESRDGHEWTFPKLGLFEVRGTRENNVILREPPFVHNFSPFLDGRPGVADKERFKALAGVEEIVNVRLLRNPPGSPPVHGELAEIHRRFGYPEGYAGGLYGFVSADGIHWQRSSDRAAINVSKEKAFDSQNVAFWSEVERLYVCYFRTWVDPHTGRGGQPHGLRTISRTTSPDFVNWSEPVAMEPNLHGEHLYTSQTHPYFRAPHIYIALPTRFMPARGASTDILFMASRAGSTSYDRLFTGAFIRPGLDPARWGNRSNYVALNVVSTGPAEMSIYHKSGHRYVLRTDGFVSVHAGAREGELLTKPLKFAGNKLIVNYSRSAAGSLRIEIWRPDGAPIPEFRLNDCPAIIGDSIEQPVRWSGSVNLERLAGEPVRLRFVMTECDLYSFRFRET